MKDLENEGHPVVYIDFFKVSSREKLIELYAREVVRPLKSWEKGLQWIQGLIRGIQPAMGLDQAGLPELRLSIDPSQTASPECQLCFPWESAAFVLEHVFTKRQGLLQFREVIPLTEAFRRSIDDVFR